jgi:hypothetical protein
MQRLGTQIAIPGRPEHQGMKRHSEIRSSFMSFEPNEEIVRLATATNPAQAHIWEQALLDADIRCQVVGDYLDAGIGDVPGMQAELWVRKEDLARAEEIIRSGHEADVNAE